MKVLAVLSHLMSKEGVLERESVARAKMTIQLFEKENYQLLITNGWAYRADCQTPIADVFAEFISNNSDIDKNCIISDVNSRDTVGDAYYLRKRLSKNGCSDLTVVTSDYHVQRTKIIFEKFFSGILNLSVIGADTASKEDPKTLEHESKSIVAFQKTFEDVNFSEEHSIYRVLSTLHPFYNGDIHPKI